MNKIPFTSQNPYAFYAKTIDRYDTEEYKESNKTKSIKKERGPFFFLLQSANGKNLFRRHTVFMKLPMSPL